MKKNLPNQIPVFPLSGVIYFPKTNLPLNIFEKRYLQLVNDCMKKNKLMGMVQSKKNSNEVYKIGCLGKISDFQKSEDGRILTEGEQSTPRQNLKDNWWLWTGLGVLAAGAAVAILSSGGSSSSDSSKEKTALGTGEFAGRLEVGQ